MIGVITPWTAVDMPADTDGENNSGEYFTMIVSRVTEKPAPGSDEISKAYEDGWIGQNGYLDASGQRQRRSIAFLGRSEEHTSELQSRGHLVCRLLLDI